MSQKLYANLARLLAVIMCVVIITALIVQSGYAAPVTQAGRQVFNEIITKVLTVQNSATFQNTVTFQGATTQTGAATLDDVTLTGNIANRSLFLRYQDVAAAPSIYAATGVVSTSTSITTSILGIDVPRNLSITYVGNEAGVVITSTAGNITVAGVDARGNSTTELVAVSAVSGTQTLLGVIPWKSVTSLTLPTRTEDITITITGGQKFGLPLIPVASGDLYHLTVNATPQAAPTVNATYGTFDPVSTPAASVDYNVWLKQ